MPQSVEDVAPAELSDEEVVERVRAGDTPLFEILMRRYNQRLFRIARAMLRDGAEAEDVMQHAYVEAYRHLHQFAGRARFSTWLTKIAVHEALRRARRRQREPRARMEEGWEEEMASGLQAPEPSPEQRLHAQRTRQLLESAIDSLPRGYRTVFVLREVEGLNTAETAHCLGLRTDAVKTRLSRARALLREELLQRVGAASASAFAFHLTRCDHVVTQVLARIAAALPRLRDGA